EQPDRRRAGGDERQLAPQAVDLLAELVHGAAEPRPFGRELLAQLLGGLIRRHSTSPSPRSAVPPRSPLSAPAARPSAPSGPRARRSGAMPTAAARAPARRRRRRTGTRSRTPGRRRRPRRARRRCRAG